MKVNACLGWTPSHLTGILEIKVVVFSPAKSLEARAGLVVVEGRITRKNNPLSMRAILPRIKKRTA